MARKVICNQPPQAPCKIGKHKSLLAAHRDNEKKFLRQRTKSGRATKLHFQKAGYVWAGGSNRWVKKKKASTKKKSSKVAAMKKKSSKVAATKKVECDKSTRDGRLNNRNGKC